MLDALKKSADIQGEERDTVGGYLLETDVYDFTINMAYIDKSKYGATSVNLLFKTADGRNYKETVYVTNRQGENFYDKGQGKKYLPGFLLVEAITMLSIGKSISDVSTEEKTVNVYDGALKKETPQKRQVIMELIGQPITLGVELQEVDVTKLDQATNKYLPTGDVKKVNAITKAFRTADKMTAPEITAEATEAAFYTKWIETFRGKIAEKATKKAANGGTSGLPGAPGDTKPLFT